MLSLRYPADICMATPPPRLPSKPIAPVTKDRSSGSTGKKGTILIGAGARGTAPLLIEMATLLGAGCGGASYRWLFSLLLEAIAQTPRILMSRRTAF